MYRSKSETRVAIPDRHALVRGAFTALLTAEENLVVVGEAGDAGEALAVTERELPDIVLIDLDLPGTDGLETTRQIFSNPLWRAYASSCSARPMGTTRCSARCAPARAAS